MKSPEVLSPVAEGMLPCPRHTETLRGLTGSRDEGQVSAVGVIQGVSLLAQMAASSRVGSRRPGGCRVQARGNETQ